MRCLAPTDAFKPECDILHSAAERAATLVPQSCETPEEHPIVIVWSRHTGVMKQLASNLVTLGWRPVGYNPAAARGRHRCACKLFAQTWNVAGLQAARGNPTVKVGKPSHYRCRSLSSGPT